MLIINLGEEDRQKVEKRKFEVMKDKNPRIQGDQI